MKTSRDPRDLAPEALLTVKQAAELMQASIFYVKERIASGEIASIPWGREGKPRIPKKAVTRFIDRKIEHHEAQHEKITRMVESR